MSRREPIAMFEDQLGARTLERQVWPFEISELDAPVEAHLSFFIEAEDNDPDRNAGEEPKRGKSTVFSLKVVSPQDLRSELLRREAEQRMEFERLLKEQSDLLVETEAALAGLDPQAENLDRSDYTQLAAAEKNQRLLAGQSGGVVRQFMRVRREVINNRLEEEGGPLQSRLQLRIIDPIQQLVQDAMPAAANRIDTARKPATSAEDRVAALTDAVNQQREIVNTMEQILENMVKMEGYQQAINLVREMLETQKNIEERTARELESEIEDIFD